MQLVNAIGRLLVGFIGSIEKLEALKMSLSKKIVNDPIHGIIELHALCVKIIDTPQFQRLRFLKQLGMAYFVYPGASHNRFEHCIGVSHLAGRFVRLLQIQQTELEITETDVLCLEIAGLLHDLGHGPFSHMFNIVLKKVDEKVKWKHEQCSADLFDHLMKQNNLDPIFKKYLSEKDKLFIKELIAGPQDHSKGGATQQDWQYRGRPKEKSFLYEIVANERNGIDVDKWDYIARDCHMLGMKSNFDHDRCMKLARVLEVDGVRQICFRDNEASNLYDLFATRTVLHRRAYQHRVTKTIEAMMEDALYKANEYIKIPGQNGRKRKISECIHDMDAFTKLTDSVFHQILLSDEPELEPARRLLDRIMTRNLYVCVGKTSLDPNDINLEGEIEDAIVSPEGKDTGTIITKEDFVIRIRRLDFGKKMENPIDHVTFYAKDDINEHFKLKKDQVSKMLPTVFCEKTLYVLCRDENEEKIDAITKRFKQWNENRPS